MMPSFDWKTTAEIATVISTVAFAVSAVVVALQLRQAARERYFSITAHLFEIWQSTEFQHDQLFLLHKLPCTTWQEFCALGRGEHAERALHRVGGYYDRVGNLVRHKLIQKDDILPTIGGYAVAVWDRIEPLVKELRLRENAILFENYETLLPECHDCYVPGKGTLDVADLLSGKAVTTDEFAEACENEPAADPTIGAQPNGAPAREGNRQNGIETANVAAHDGDATSEESTDNSPAETIAMTDAEMKANGQAQIAPDLALPDSDGITRKISEFTASGTTILVYGRGHT
ncbi:MAG: DUF4760 domain-containing protein [Candidatus Binataceae bacterium]